MVMTMTKFAVTYERWTEEDVEHGDTDDRGFVIQDVSLTDAIQLGLEYRRPEWCGTWEADNGRGNSDTRWLDFYEWNSGTREEIMTGIRERRTLHIPDSVTPASRQRIVKLFSR